LNISDEINKNYVLPDGVIKRLTGGQNYQINPKYGKPQMIAIKTMFVIAANQFLKISDTSKGASRRPHYLPFNQIQRKDLIPNFFEKMIKEEIPFILSYILEEGAKYFLADGGFKEPEFVKIENEEAAVKNTTTAYMDSQFKTMLFDAYENIKGGEEWDFKPYTHNRFKPFFLFANSKDANKIYFEPYDHYSDYSEFCKRNGYHASSSNNFRSDCFNYFQLWLERTFDKDFVLKGNGKVERFGHYWKKDGEKPGMKRLKYITSETNNFREDFMEYIKEKIEQGSVKKIEVGKKKYEIVGFENFPTEAQKQREAGYVPSVHEIEELEENLEIIASGGIANPNKFGNPFVDKVGE